MTRVCLYLRISTDEDHQPTSLRTQRERLERYCQAMEDWHVVHAFDDQASGVTLERPGLTQALGLARERRFDLLLVYRVDRLSRKVRQLAGLAEELDRLDIVLKSATEPFDTGSPAGRMMLQMLGVFAEFEHATIVDRVTAGLERRVREGRWMSGRTPYGYARADGSLVPDPVKAPIVRRIYQLYAEGKLGTTAIARQLDAEGAPAPRKHGWSPNALQLILANPAYRGLIRWNAEIHPGLHEPLVDEETFEKAQQILRRRGEDASLRRGNQSDFLLSGLVRCDHCGRAYVGTSAMAATAATRTTPARPATSTAPRSATASGSRRTASKQPSSHSSPSSTATAGSSSAHSPMRRSTWARSRRASRSSSPRHAPRSPKSNASSSATSKHSRPATSQPRFARNASVATVSASRPSAPTKPTSPKRSPHKRTRRQTRPPSPASQTNSTRSSPTKALSRRRNSCGCSSKRSACTTAAESSRPIGFRRRFAQYLRRWSQPGSNRRPSGCQPDALPTELWPQQARSLATETCELPSTS
jgi:DNA invertase Pin-like site-specific DNA recombinase